MRKAYDTSTIIAAGIAGIAGGIILVDLIEDLANGWRGVTALMILTSALLQYFTRQKSARQVEK